MWPYSLKCGNNTKSKNPEIPNNENDKTMLFSKCVACGSKKPKFIKDQEASGLLNQLGLTLLWTRFNYWAIFYFKCVTTSIIIKKILLASDKLVSDIHLRQPGFMYSVSAVDHSQKIKQENENLKKQEALGISTEMK